MSLTWNSTVTQIKHRLLAKGDNYEKSFLTSAGGVDLLVDVPRCDADCLPRTDCTLRSFSAFLC